MNYKIDSKLAALTAALLLASCGGSSGGNGGSDSAKTPSENVTLSGQVVDAPIQDATVCLYIDGELAKTSAGADICSAATDAEGNYTLIIPRTLNMGFATLIAAKDEIQLASTLGAMSSVIAAAGSTGNVGLNSVPEAKVTHFTSADFALADTNEDGFVDANERTSYTPDPVAVREIATLIKAVVDFDKGSVLLNEGNNIAHTLALARAAAKGDFLGDGTVNKADFLADPDNAPIAAAVAQEVAEEANTDNNLAFHDYQLNMTITNSSGDFQESESDPLYCHIDNGGDGEIVQIALDASRQLAVLKYEDEEESGVIGGTYNPNTGAFSLTEYMPPYVSHVTATGVNYYHESLLKVTGTYDQETQSITGTFQETLSNTMTGSSEKATCNASGNFTLNRVSL